MKTNTLVPTHWSTASDGDAADTSPLELSALGAHLELCQGSGGRLFAMQCVVQRMHGFVVRRFVTILAAATLLIGIFSQVL